VGINNANPIQAVKSVLQLVNGELQIGDEWKRNIDSIQKLIVIGAGKATAAMAIAVEEILGRWITAGAVNIPAEILQSVPKTTKIRLHVAGHPFVTEETITGTKTIEKLLSNLSENDLVLCLISGGGSAMLELPQEGLSLGDLQSVFQLLTKKGATIHELNVIRKHLSRVKGGWLAIMAQPAQVVSLIISDVVGDKLDTIASGPTVPDTSTWNDVKQIIEKYDLNSELPEKVKALITRGLQKDIAETPKGQEPAFKRVWNILIGSNTISCAAMKEKAIEKGLTAKVISTTIMGEAREIGKQLAEELLTMAENSLLIAGGETTVTLTGTGLGGRNQETALAASLVLEDNPGCFFVAVGSDGKDGPTEAAGALVDYQTIAKGREKGLEAETFLANNDSYHFLRQTNSLILTGPTGTNVSDLFLGLKLEAKKQP